MEFQSPRGTGLEALWIIQFSKYKLCIHKQSDNCKKEREFIIIIIIIIVHSKC